MFKDGKLVTAFLAKNPEKKLQGAFAWTSMANEIVRRLVDDHGLISADVFVIEAMPAYPRDTQAKKLALLQTQGTAGAISFAVPAKLKKSFLPREWKGSVPGDAFAARTDAKLTDDERCLIQPCAASARHNILDAVALGWFSLGQ